MRFKNEKFSLRLGVYPGYNYRTILIISRSKSKDLIETRLFFWQRNLHLTWSFPKIYKSAYSARQHEQEIIPTIEELGIGLVAYSLLGTTKIHRMLENIGAVSIELSTDELKLQLKLK